MEKKLLFDNKALRKLIIPLILEQLLATTIGLADTVMVASCGEAAVSGISLVDSINFLFITLFAALATGGSVIASQYIGMGDKKEASKSANQLFYVSLFVSLIFGFICAFFRKPILNTIYHSLDSEVMSNALIYFLLTASSYPFLAVYNSGAALFRAMGDSKTSMYTSFLMNGLNVIGNAVLIFVFHLGVLGAASATLFSRIVGALFITILLLDKKRTLCYTKLLNVKFNFGIIRKILYIGIPNGIENSVFQIGKIIVASIISVLGTASITANAVCGNLAGIQITPGMAIGIATLTVIGQCTGAQDFEQARKYAKKLMFLAYCCTWVMTAFIFILNKPILNLYNLSEETRRLTLQCFLIHGICATTIWVPAFPMANILRAANDVTYTMWVSLISMMLLRVILTYFLVNFFHVGVVGVWIAMCSDWLVRAFFFFVRLKGDKWTKKKLI